jgi:hypothetical protein
MKNAESGYSEECDKGLRQFELSLRLTEAGEKAMNLLAALLKMCAG